MFVPDVKGWEPDSPEKCNRVPNCAWNATSHTCRGADTCLGPNGPGRHLAPTLRAVACRTANCAETTVATVMGDEPVTTLQGERLEFNVEKGGMDDRTFTNETGDYTYSYKEDFP